MKIALNVLIAGTALLVMGCQSRSQITTAPPAPVAFSPGYNADADANADTQQALPQGSVRYETEDARVAKLWTMAENVRNEGDTDRALQLLFEGIEIQPQNSLLWSRAAEIQLNNKQAALAENLAVKSNDFAGNNESLLHRNWLIIEHARSLRGDLLGVRSAHKKVQEYQYR